MPLIPKLMWKLSGIVSPTTTIDEGVWIQCDSWRHTCRQLGVDLASTHGYRGCDFKFTGFGNFHCDPPLLLCFSIQLYATSLLCDNVRSWSSLRCELSHKSKLWHTVWGPGRGDNLPTVRCLFYAFWDALQLAANCSIEVAYWWKEGTGRKMSALKKTLMWNKFLGRGLLGKHQWIKAHLFCTERIH